MAKGKIGGPCAFGEDVDAASGKVVSPDDFEFDVSMNLRITAGLLEGDVQNGFNPIGIIRSMCKIG